MRAPEVAVVLPTFNRWAFLSRALASALSQRGPEIEVLVIDDGSSDETSERLSALSDPRLRVLRQPSNRGVARARNRGIAEARAPWIAFLDDDDFWAPDRLREHLRIAADHEADWVYGSVVSIDPEGAVREDGVSRADHSLGPRLFESNAVGSPSTVTARTELVRSVGGFDENLAVLADWDLWLRLDRAGKGWPCRRLLVAYTEHAENMQLTDWSRIPREFAYLVTKHGAEADRAGVRMGGDTFTLWVAKNHRRAGRRFRAAGGYMRSGIANGAPMDVLRGLGLLAGQRVMTRVARRAAARTIAPPGWVEDARGAGVDALARAPAAPVR